MPWGRNTADVAIITKEELLRVPIFPLAGALLFPRAQLPLHIFEPRYRAMISDSMAREVPSAIATGVPAAKQPQPASLV